MTTRNSRLASGTDNIRMSCFELLIEEELEVSAMIVRRRVTRKCKASCEMEDDPVPIAMVITVLMTNLVLPIFTCFEFVFTFLNWYIFLASIVIAISSNQRISTTSWFCLTANSWSDCHAIQLTLFSDYNHEGTIQKYTGRSGGCGVPTKSWMSTWTKHVRLVVAWLSLVTMFVKTIFPFFCQFLVE